MALRPSNLLTFYNMQRLNIPHAHSLHLGCYLPSQEDCTVFRKEKALMLAVLRQLILSVGLWCPRTGFISSPTGNGLTVRTYRKMKDKSLALPLCHCVCFNRLFHRCGNNNWQNICWFSPKP